MFSVNLNLWCYFQDDPPAMDFVTAAANLRMNVFSMNMKSRFDVKCECFTVAMQPIVLKLFLVGV